MKHWLHGLAIVVTVFVSMLWGMFVVSQPHAPKVERVYCI